MVNYREKGKEDMKMVFGKKTKLFCLVSNMEYF